MVGVGVVDAGMVEMVEGMVIEEEVRGVGCWVGCTEGAVGSGWAL